MRQTILIVSALLGSALLFACGGSMAPVQVANGVPMSLSLGAIWAFLIQ